MRRLSFTENITRESVVLKAESAWVGQYMRSEAFLKIIFNQFFTVLIVNVSLFYQ